LIKNRPIEINPKKKSKDAENKINKEREREWERGWTTKPWKMPY
jgi:hypothetical protein